MPAPRTRGRINKNFKKLSEFEQSLLKSAKIKTNLNNLTKP